MNGEQPWIVENLFSVSAMLISVSLGINTLYGTFTDRRRIRSKDSTEQRVLVTDANNDQLTLTFNAIIKHNELLAKQHAEMEVEFQNMRKAYNSLLNRDNVREVRESILIGVIRTNLNVDIPRLPDLPPLVEI